LIKDRNYWYNTLNIGVDIVENFTSDESEIFWIIEEDEIIYNEIRKQKLNKIIDKLKNNQNEEC
jgi:outer membrane lipopolysaccharide assembly protein LptE/RlpB